MKKPRPRAHLSQASTVPAGRRVAHYEILREIGRGGMGVVYLAQDLNLGRKVALKCISPEYAGDPGAHSRFMRESHTASSLDHPHIVTIHEAFHEQGCSWLVMALVEGNKLHDVLKNDGPLPLREALRHAEDLTSALEAAHDHHILHRDINPNNVLMARDGRALLVDFGLARYFHPSGRSSATTEATALTRPGLGIGTPGYMSPEQAEGRNVDQRSDIYSLGTLLFEICTGRKASMGWKPGAVSGALNTGGSSLSGREIPRGLEHIIGRMMESDPDKRYQDAKSVLQDLHSLRQKLRVLTYDEEHPWASPWISWRRAGMFLCIALPLALLLGWAAFLVIRELQRPAHPLPTGIHRQVTSAAGWETEPALSPQGNLIAYMSDETGSHDLWIVSTDGARPFRLTEGPAKDHSPAWFPDGRSLAFVSNRGGQEAIWTIPILGGSPRLLLENAEHPAVSPDGTRLAFRRPGEHDSETRIFVVDLTGASEPRQLSFRQHGLWDHSNPSWSQDGKRISYSGQSNLWIVNADGSEPPRALTADDAGDGHPKWSSGDGHIYFSSFREGTLALWRIRPDGTGTERVTSGSGPESQPSLSSDGRLIAYSTDDPDPELVYRDTGGREWLPVAGTSVEADPRLMPDLSGMVFVSNRWGGTHGLWFLPFVGGTPSAVPPRRVTDHEGPSTHPTLSPDGRWVAYYRVIDGQRDLWAKPLEGGTAVQLTRHPAADLQPAWSPDGGRLAFVSERSGNSDIWVLPVHDGQASGEPERLTNVNGVAALAPAWSPDGLRIAYTCGRGAMRDVCIVPVDGSAPPREITKGAMARRIGWEAHTGLLLVSGQWDGKTLTLRRLHPSGEWSREFDPPVVLGQDAPYASFDSSRDGSLLVYNNESRRGDIWVMEAEMGIY